MFLPDKDLPKTTSNNAMFGKYTGMRLSGEYKNNANEGDNASNIKRLKDFKSPFQEQEEISRSSAAFDLQSKSVIAST